MIPLLAALFGVAVGLFIGWLLGIGALRIMSKDIQEAKEWAKRPRKVVA